MATITLRPFVREDVPALIEWTPTAEFLAQWAANSLRFPLDASQFDPILEQAAAPQPALLAYTAVLADPVSGSSRDVGHLELAAIDRQNESARIVRVLLGPPDLRGQGNGTKMIREAVRIGFEELKLHRLSLAVFDFNHGAIACYEKAGFQREGLRRDAFKCAGQFWSAWEMSLLAPEWAAQR